MVSIIKDIDDYIEAYKEMFNEEPECISLTLAQYSNLLKKTKTPIGEGIDTFNNIPIKVLIGREELPPSDFASIKFHTRNKRRNNGKNKK